jgi:subtilase family serine protease
MAEGDVSGVITDLRTAEKAFGLPQVPVTVVQVGLASPDTSGADEWDLDTQYSSGMAGYLKRLYIYATTSLTDSDLALEFSRWATDDKAKAASASLGECEVFPYLDGSMLADDNTFLEAAAQGQTFFASTGDTGSFCPAEVGENGVPAGAPLVNYPAASQYAVAAGGTTLLANSDGNYDIETAWYAGGGGISQFEYSPYWQVNANIPSATELSSRGIPDIAMDADPYSGANVYVDGSVEIVGGTSLSSPLSLGVWARMISAQPKLGFAPLRFYGLYDGTGVVGSYPEGGFHDIILGSDGLYSAAPGWDYTTGLGSLWVSQLYTDLK